MTKGELRKFKRRLLRVEIEIAKRGEHGPGYLRLCYEMALRHGFTDLAPVEFQGSGGEDDKTGPDHQGEDDQ